MTGVERNAKCHTSSRLSLKTEPFWNLLYFLECMHQVGWTEKMKVTLLSQCSRSLSLSPPMHAVWCLYTLLCLQWMPAIWWIRTSQRAFSARTGIRQRYSKPGANTKHLNVKSVISIPKSLNIEIRSSVQQRPIFTLIYHSCPCTQGLITPYMVNKPLACTRQYDVHTKTMYLLYSNSSSSGLHLDHAIIQKCTAQNRMGTCTLDYFDARGHLDKKQRSFYF